MVGPSQVIQFAKDNAGKAAAAAYSSTNPVVKLAGGLGVVGNAIAKSGYDFTPDAAPDPYAAYGGTAAYNNLVSGFNNQKSNIYGSANEAASGLQGQYGLSVQDTLRNLQQGQSAIDRKATNNESSKLQGTQGVMGMVSRGIKSGGVMLANRNAGNSSAAGAIANAYGDQGTRQLSTIGNQYAQNAEDIALDQQNQDYAASTAPKRFHEQLMQSVNGIVTDARNQLAQLDAAMASANLPGRIAIEQEKEAIKAQVLGKLQQYDQQLAAGAGNIKASTREQNMTKAQSQIQAGQADPNIFNYTTEAPAGFSNTGPAATNLPLFTLNKQRRQV